MDPDSLIGRAAEWCDGISVATPSVGAVIALAVAGVLLYVLGIISAAEIAFFSLTAEETEELDEEDTRTDRCVKALLADSERLLATLLAANNLIGVTIVLLCNYFFDSVWQGGVLKYACIIMLIAFLLLLFGEIMPKMYSSRNALAFCRRWAAPVKVLEFLFRPLANPLVRSSFVITRVAQRRKNKNLSVDELSQALELTDKNEISEESKMLEGIIRFGEETAKEVMTSRLDMVDLDISTPYPQVLQCIVDNAYSRIPIYKETRDNIKGILYIKDLLPYLDEGEDFHWQKLIRPAYFVPETKMIDDLLRDFQAAKVHIAIVVDEFGGTSGIITMEDIIEEIVGEINDEYDDEERTYVKVGSNAYVFEAKTLLTDFYRVLDIDPELFDEAAEDADTLAGLLLELKGEFPALHEVIKFKNYQFEILEMDARRILKVKVTILPEEPEAEEKEK